MVKNAYNNHTAVRNCYLLKAKYITQQMHPNRLTIYVCMYVSVYVCMHVCKYVRNRASLYVYSMYVCVYAGTHMSDTDNMPTIFVQACMYKQLQSKTQLCETYCYTAGASISFGVLCKLLIVVMRICKGYLLYVLVFKTCSQCREEHFMVVVPSALAPTCTHTALLGTGALHDLTTYSCDIDYQCPKVRHRRASRTGSEQQRFTHMFL